MEAARELHRLNANVIITGRSVKKAEDFIASLPNKDNKVEFIQSDFSDLKNVEDLAQNLKKNHPKIDILINNAGAFVPEYTPTA